MPNPTAIVNPAGDSTEAILHYARFLGKDAVRRQVFECIYGRGQRPRSKKQIIAAANIDESKKQQVQNALDHLSKHHLISKVENDGSVKDRSRWLYGKLETIRALRKDIERYADDPKAAAKVPTKRNPTISGETTARQVTRQQLRQLPKLTVLYMIANPNPGPITSTHIRPEAEVRMVQEAVRGSKFSQNVEIQLRVAADLKTMMNGLNDHIPQVVHFSGHSNTSGIAVDTGSVTGPAKDFLPYDLFAKALRAVDKKPEIVVLNSCLSASARRVVLESTQALVGMNDSISDIAAAAFAQQFYAALASGQSLESSFGQGVIAVEAVSLTEKKTPQLYLRSGISADKIKLT